GFTWHEQDEELGLVNMKGRTYDPKVGRFLTPDPVVPDPMSGQSWNPYSYVDNNPLTYVDPTGYDPEIVYEKGFDYDAEGNIIGLHIWYGWEDKETNEPQAQANREARLTGSSPVPVDVGTIGTTVGFVPQCSATALEQSTATKVTADDEDDDSDPSWRQHPV